MSANASTFAYRSPTNYGRVDTFKRVAANVAQNILWRSTVSGNTTRVDNHKSIHTELALRLEDIRSQLEVDIAEDHKSLTEIKEDIILSLGRLEDGWDGMRGLAPCSETIANVEKFLHQIKFDPNTAAPEIEVDEEGRVTLRWSERDSGSLAFSVSKLDQIVICSVKANGSLDFVQHADSHDSEALDKLIGQSEATSKLSVY